MNGLHQKNVLSERLKICSSRQCQHTLGWVSHPRCENNVGKLDLLSARMREWWILKYINSDLADMIIFWSIVQIVCSLFGPHTIRSNKLDACDPVSSNESTVKRLLRPPQYLCTHTVICTCLKFLQLSDIKGSRTFSLPEYVRGYSTSTSPWTLIFIKNINHSRYIFWESYQSEYIPVCVELSTRSHQEYEQFNAKCYQCFPTRPYMYIDFQPINNIASTDQCFKLLLMSCFREIRNGIDQWTFWLSLTLNDRSMQSHGIVVWTTTKPQYLEQDNGVFQNAIQTF